MRLLWSGAHRKQFVPYRRTSSGGSSADNVIGTNSAENLVSGGGNDTLDGMGRHDALVGGEGDDQLVFDVQDNLRLPPIRT